MGFLNAVGSSHAAWHVPRCFASPPMKPCSTTFRDGTALAEYHGRMNILALLTMLACLDGVYFIFGPFLTSWGLARLKLNVLALWSTTTFMPCLWSFFRTLYFQVTFYPGNHVKLRVQVRTTVERDEWKSCFCEQEILSVKSQNKLMDVVNSLG